MARYWEKLKDEGESDKAYAAFVVWRDLPDSERTFELASKMLGKHASNIRGWANKWHWHERLQALQDRDSMIRQEVREQVVRERAEEEATRREDLRSKNLANEERAAIQVERFLDHVEQMPLVQSVVTETREIAGEQVEVRYDISSVSRTPVMDVKRLHEVATKSAPEKVQIGKLGEGPEYGKDPAEVDREFEELVREGRTNLELE